MIPSYTECILRCCTQVVCMTLIALNSIMRTKQKVAETRSRLQSISKQVHLQVTMRTQQCKHSSFRWLHKIGSRTIRESWDFVMWRMVKSEKGRYMGVQIIFLRSVAHNLCRLKIAFSVLVVWTVHRMQYRDYLRINLYSLWINGGTETTHKKTILNKLNYSESLRLN